MLTLTLPFLAAPSLAGVEPDEIDFQTAASCPGGAVVADGVLNLDPKDPWAGVSLADLTLSVLGVEPDEIDLCLEEGSSLVVAGIEVVGVVPEALGATWLDDLVASTPVAQTREHVLLARQVGVPAATAPVEPLGHASLALDTVTLWTEVGADRVTRTFATLAWTVVGLVAADASVEPLSVLIDTDTAIVPEIPLCSRCNLGP